MGSAFAKLFGNTAAVERLVSAVRSGTLSHALLVVGPRGSGKHTLATELAAAIVCEGKSNGAAPLPCGTCKNCKRIYSGNFPDHSVLKKEQGKATIGADEVRLFREDMLLSAVESDRKIYVIEDADCMTPQAQNALLKVLEEPPPMVHIILLATDADNILSTIKSRTQLVRTEIFDPDTEERLLCRLSAVARELSVSDPLRLRSVILSSGGVIGSAIESLEGKRMEAESGRRAAVMSVIQAMPRKTPFSKIHSALTSLPEKRSELRELLEDTVKAVADMLISKKCEGCVPQFFLSAEECEEAASALSAKRLTLIYDVFAAAIADLDKNVLVAPLLCDIAVKLKEAEKGK